MGVQFHTAKELSEAILEAIKNDSTGTLSVGDFIPSIYSGLKSATTTVSGQSEAFASGAKRLQITNKDSTNTLVIGFGMTATEAEANTSGGVAGKTKFVILQEGFFQQSIGAYEYYAWLGVGGTVSIRAVQGV